MAEARTSLVSQILGGENRDLRVLAAKGLLPLPPAELIPLQVRLARDPDPEVAGRAAAALKATEPATVAAFLADEAGEEELSFFASESFHPVVLESLLRRRDIPLHLLVEMAPRLPIPLQEVLILRQDAIGDAPEILDALERNPELASYVERRIGEYREHMFAPLTPPEPPEAEEVELPAEAASSRPLDDPEVQQAILQVGEEPEEGERDEQTGLTEGQVRQLPVPVKMKLSYGAGRRLRRILLRDQNSSVALSVLNNSALSDDEIEQVCRGRAVVDDVLAEIGRRREWVSKYAILTALVNNPRTPAGIGVRLVPRLSLREMRLLSTNRNVSDAVRNAARRTFEIKSR